VHFARPSTALLRCVAGHERLVWGCLDCRRAAMDYGDHLIFAISMLPTFVLLGLAALTLAGI